MLMIGNKQVSPSVIGIKPYEIVSNCLWEIPQNIKLELSGKTVTLKSGSTVALTNRAVYTTQTTTQDYSVELRNNTTIYLIWTGSTLYTYSDTWKMGSGSELPIDDSDFHTFFYINGNYVRYYLWNADSSSWKGWGNDASYPLAIIKTENNISSFVKDANGNDMIFNGAGFAGHHVFVLPGIKALIPNGLNDDGTKKSIEITKNSLSIIELAGSTPYLAMGYNGGINRRPSFFEVNTMQDLYNTNLQGFYYVKETNEGYSWGGGSSTLYKPYLKFIDVNYDGTYVTNFTIQQPQEIYRYVLKKKYIT